jgi:hypothetical protein
MIKISKTNQRKLYQMYKEAINGKLSGQIQMRYDHGWLGDSEDNLRNKAKTSLKEFLSFLEDGIE